ncbi:TRAM domain-containing protein [Propioniciclava soli]|uniref:TRAM domain-containing protein n=1 Tax=Propioniciclava soli TaxID=2775081 RepID=A0ABZ3CC07_9ACTN
MTTELAVGDVVGPVRVGRVAHGGHWVARHEGRVIFVRHTLEGELVRVRITEVAKRFARGDAMGVEEASPHRVAAPCPVAGVCGGCDLQHVAPAHQRELKRQVIAEQLDRLAGVSFSGSVEAVTPEALGWRTRVRYLSDGRAWGLRAHRSHTVVPLPEQGCLIARPPIARPEVGPGPAGSQRLGVESRGEISGPAVHWLAAAGASDAVPDAEPGAATALEEGGPGVVVERAAGRTFRVRTDGFWQVHPEAADTLAAAVVAALDPQPGESAVDLYCGVGLFAGALSAQGVDVVGVEGSREAVALASSNVPEATFRAGPVERLVRKLPPRVDLVVLDPPRAGAGRAVMEQVCARRPRAIAYVACDPAALARDLATAAGLGYHVAGVRAFDLFGMTHHVECVALLVPAAAGASDE